MTSTTVRAGRRLCVVLAAAAVLAGCSSAGGGVVRAGPAVHTSSAAAPAYRDCADSLDLSWADNGSRRCVHLGSDITVGLIGPNSSWHAGVDVVDLIGSVLTVQPLPMPLGLVRFKATSPGMTVIVKTSTICMTTGPCPATPPWSVTVVAKE